jgi:hypothetical protein
MMFSVATIAAAIAAVGFVSAGHHADQREKEIAGAVLRPR